MPVRRAHANHRTACVERRRDFEARKVAQWVEHLATNQTVEGSTPSFSLVKALNRLAVRIRSGCYQHPSSQHPGAVPAGGNRCGASASGRSPARDARAALRGGQRIDADDRPAGRDDSGQGCLALRQARRSSARSAPSPAARAWGALPILSTLFFNSTGRSRSQ